MSTEQSASAPKVFLSHASEDKERFVVSFATALRAKGIDVWLDKWEVLPGDSLVDKLFEEGLKHADAVLVVVSSNSISKPWVREELNAAVVKRIAKNCKLIPILLDDCEVPESLKSLVWERIPNLNAFEPQLATVADAIFDHRKKPPLGPPPQYLQQSITIPGLTAADVHVFRQLYDDAFAKDHPLWQAQEIASMLPELQEEQLLDSLEILNEQGFIKIQRCMGGPRGIAIIQPSLFGFTTYADNFISTMKDDIRAVALAILNENAQSSVEVQAETGRCPFLVDQLLDLFESRGWIELARAIGATHIFKVSPSFRRAFQ